MTRQAIVAAGGLEAVSADLGLGLSTLSRAYSDEDDRPGGLGVKYLHQLGRIVPDAAVPVANHFAMLAGGVFLPMPHQGGTHGDLNSLTKEFSDVLNQHAMAHSEASPNPEDYTSKEAMTQYTEVEELVQAGLRMMAALKERF
jgi:hypothetical protein